MGRKLLYVTIPYKHCTNLFIKVIRIYNKKTAFKQKLDVIMLNIFSDAYVL